MVCLIKIVSFWCQKIKLFFFDTTAKEYRHMKLTNIFAITNLTRYKEEQENQTPSHTCRSKTCDNPLVGGWVSKSDPRYCGDCL